MPTRILKELYDLLKTQYIDIRYVSDDSPCGFCILNNNKTVIINRNLPENTKIAELVKIIKENELDKIYIKPYIRDLLEDIDIIETK